MSFQPPKIIPSFTDPRRKRDDTVWSAAGMQSAPFSPSNTASFSNRVASAIYSNRDLPLYKDKPYYSSGTAGRTGRRRIRRKRNLIGLLVVGVVVWWYCFAGGEEQVVVKSYAESWKEKLRGGRGGKKEVVDWNQRAEEVKQVFLDSWNAYEESAWGFDEFHPISKTHRNMAKDGLGWIIVDSLDTLMLMNCTKELATARQWVKNSLTWDQDQEVNTFETTIRMLGGLLSAHYLQTELKLVPLEDKNADLYLEKATDLADRLLGAYSSQSGIPYASVNLKTGIGKRSHADGGSSSTAEAATLQLEMKYLAYLTGEVEYWKAAEKVMEVIHNNNDIKDGLVPIFISPENGKFYGKNIRLGSRGDSYYEYLLKQYLQTNEHIYDTLYQTSTAGIKKHLIHHSLPSHLTYVAELPMGVGSSTSPKMDHLVCFLGGNFALGATSGATVEKARKDWGGRKWSSTNEEDLRLARELTHTCYQMYNVTATGLAPEIAFFNTEERYGDVRGETEKDIIIKPADAHNLQRPETVESLFLMWRITGEEIYRQWGWEIFQSFRKWTAVAADGSGKEGYTSLNDVTKVPPTTRDNMESFWLAETLKYLYLLFKEGDGGLPLERVVFNTEAHPFPRFEMGSFKTGWNLKGGEATGIAGLKVEEVKRGAVPVVEENVVS